MKTSFRAFLIAIQSILTSAACWAGTLYVDLNNTSPAPPYANWSAAATNIQDAIDAASPGDLVLVTNGVYIVGGKVMFGDLTNRVALDKPITVQSVNGPWFTTIFGAGATNGTAAVRCAWLTNGAELNGFTLTAGATRTSGDQTNLMSGGGALCFSNALLRNCLVISNLASVYGGGVLQGLIANSAIIGNRCSANGSGAAYAALLNCTVVSNWSFAATYQCRHTNTIAYYNAVNYSGGTLAFSCTQPAPGGVGNITAAPQLYPDSIHLAETSPCRNAGTNLASGTDIDGQAWNDLPSIGCDEWQKSPIIIRQPRIELTNNPIGFRASVIAAGQEPLVYYWTRNVTPIEADGHFTLTHATNLMAAGVTALDAGSYQVVASNSFGMVTSAVAQLIFRYVNEANPAPAFPHASWATAATNIQDAIDAAAAGEVVLVTNGLYRYGGKLLGSDLTNRVSLDKALILQSVNGPETTIIQGNWNPTVTNGPLAVRCAWLTNGAALSGFTLRGGATRENTLRFQIRGGGVWGSSTSATVFNCTISTNTAYYQGGGAFGVSLFNCTLTGNRAVGSGTPGAGSGAAGEGGGAYGCLAQNCLIFGNYADQTFGGGASSCKLINCALIGNSSYLDGGAVYGGSLLNCTVTKNISSGFSSGYGAAVNSAAVTNSVIWGNYSRTAYPNTNYANSTLAYCLSSPLASGSGNIAVDPQILTDGVHVAESSPCRAAGTNLTVAADIDGQSWANPPSIGCDEWMPAPVITLAPTVNVGISSRSLTFNVSPAGQLPLSFSWFKDGVLIQDDTHYTNAGSINLRVLKFGPEDSGNYYVVVGNSAGSAMSQAIKVTVRCVDPGSATPASPYLTWATAASTLQNAVDASSGEDIILATNGIYSVGGRVVSGDLTNRVAIDKAVILMSVNGYRNTVIQGAWDPTGTNGTLAIRAVWLGDGATLGGFTVQNGATRISGSAVGGGVLGASTNASVVNCLLTNNSAYSFGGGAYSVTLKNCILTGNSAISASGGGGGAANSSLFNCTVVNNLCFGSGAPFRGAGARDCFIRNSIVAQNLRRDVSPLYNSDDHYESSLALGGIWYSCCPTLITLGQGNILTNPTFLDADYHIPVVSPCRGTGSLAYSNGEDIDGEPWANPPSMGADEVIDANLVGPISLVINYWQTNTLVGATRFLNFLDSITGRVSRIDWDFGDGVAATNLNYYASHAWTNAGTYTVTSTAYNSDHPLGVSASIDVQVLPLISPTLGSLALDSSGFKFSFTAQENGRYTVQYATNLAAPITWQTLQSIFFSPGGNTQITDPARTNAARFYRVLVQ